MVELIITEKPSSAQKIAEALGEDKLVKKKSKQSSYYELQFGKKKILVTSAVGHLFGLAEEEKKGWNYPVFAIKWEASYKSSGDLKYIKDYIDTIAMLAKNADEFTIACDYDVEGEVIGWNVIRFVCGQKDANRMKFSTLTKPDLVEAYQTKIPHLDWGQAYAGETRHKLDWFYGINLSRALTASVKAAGSFKVMSAGRVQGPALKILADRELEISKFKPQPFWEIILQGEFQKTDIEALHEAGKMFEKKKVEEILQKVRGEKEVLVNDVKRTQRQQAPPTPFDLTTLQTEAYAIFKFSPKQTLDIAQSLYLAGLTSYPRTSSQKLDPKIGFAKILKDLSKQTEYQQLTQQLLSQKELKPNNGSKTDPAHPAIFPTGVMPKTLKPQEKKVYDLVVKRFMATFAPPALRETMDVFLDVKNEKFIAKGTRTLEANWHLFYSPYVKVDELILPNLKKGDIIKIKKLDKVDKETQPPNRYNQSSIIKELEKRNLGTKATRADIVERLYQRGYVEGMQIKVTKFGLETVLILDKYAPTILDEKLTADFEEDMEKIREGKQKQEKVLEKAKTFLTSLLADFHKKEQMIGKELLKSVRETQDEQNYIGQCLKCKEGKLMIRYGKFGRFIACDAYPACTTTFKIPAAGMIKRSEKECPHDKYPMVEIRMKGKRPHVTCIKPDCQSKVSREEAQEAKKVQRHEIEKKCPQCGKELKIRKSFYGEFIGCSGFPACKYIEQYNTKTHQFQQPERTSKSSNN